MISFTTVEDNLKLSCGHQHLRGGSIGARAPGVGQLSEYSFEQLKGLSAKLKDDSATVTAEGAFKAIGEPQDRTPTRSCTKPSPIEVGPRVYIRTRPSNRCRDRFRCGDLSGS